MYILDLDINLISRRRIYKTRNLKELFNTTNIYFKLENKKVIIAKIDNSLYIVIYISKSFKDVVF